VQPVLLIAFVAASYLMLGGGPLWATGPLLALGALGILVNPRHTIRSGTTTRALDLAMIGLLAAIGLQLLPLPAAVSAWVSPRTPVIQQHQSAWRPRRASHHPANGFTKPRREYSLRQ
jgi:hypothetical protein